MLWTVSWGLLVTSEYRNWVLSWFANGDLMVLAMFNIVQTREFACESLLLASFNSRAPGAYVQLGAYGFNWLNKQTLLQSRKFYIKSKLRLICLTASYKIQKCSWGRTSIVQTILSHWKIAYPLRPSPPPTVNLLGILYHLGKPLLLRFSLPTTIDFPPLPEML